MNIPGSESMTLHGIFRWSFKKLTVTYSGKDVFTSSSHVQSRPRFSNHAECVLFSQSLVPRCKTKAQFLQHYARCYQLCNNPQFPVRSKSMGFKIMRIDSAAHRLVRELIADCLGPTFKTHVRSFMNEGHVVKNATKLPVLSFHIGEITVVHVACMDIAHEQALPLRVSGEAM